MPDAILTAAISTALRANEIGNESPYKLSFAGIGSSGASFGAFQGDTAVNPAALATLRSVLVGAQMAQDEVDRIINAVSVACPVDPLAPADEAAADAALASPQGQALVDALDSRSLAVVLADLDLANSAAAAAGNAIDEDAQIAICLWCNMSGTPTLLLTWVRGSAVTESGIQVAAPGNPISLADVSRYLRSTGFFARHPQNWPHFAASVATGSALLN